MMEQWDIELTARYAAYERLIEYLLTEKMTRTNHDQWEDIKAAIIGSSVIVSKGMIDVSDLEQVERQIQERIEVIFDRASDWAARVVK
jgi:hypothetical protein